MNINELKFDRDGLIPAIIKDHSSKKVLTLAYMNKESLEITLKEGKTCFWSRSRQELWRKGETSGNYQKVVSITADCDGDALVIEVIKDGPACHKGSDSCFTELVSGDTAENDTYSFKALYDLLVSRKELLPENSYTTYLFEKGLDKILKKIGEETTEVIVGAKNSKEETVYEIADLAYHVMVLMVEMGISVDEVRDELASRHVIEHKVKQEKMK